MVDFNKNIVEFRENNTSGHCQRYDKCKKNIIDENHKSMTAVAVS